MRSLFLLILLSALSATSQARTDVTLETQNDGVDLSRQDFKSVFFGHNVTPTSNTLHGGTFTVGFYAVAAGVTDHLTVGTSPWIEFGYNMHNVHMKYGGAIADDQRISVNASYFKTHDELETKFTPRGDSYHYYLYKQESVTGQLVHSWRINSIYTIHNAFSYMYYMDDTHPFSLRMQSFNDDPYELIVSSLQEAHLTKNLGLNAEMGILGLNYVYPYFHYGASLVYQSANWLFQLGISHTLVMSGSQERLNRYDYKFTNAVHPEVQAQVFF